MVNLGVIGYGVRVDMLMDEFLSLPDPVCIRAIADKNPERVRALMRKNDSPEKLHEFEIDKIDGMWRKCAIDPDPIHFYEDAAEMLRCEKLDGVIVGTGCNSHAFFAKMVLDHGLPLFLEKPVGVTRDDLALLAPYAENPPAPVVVSFPLRVTRLVREVKKLLDQNTIGKVEQIQAFNDVSYGFVYFHDWYRNEAVSHGLFLQKATHDLDVLHYLTGETPVMVCAMKSKQIYKGDMPAGLRCSACDRWETCPESNYNIVHQRNDTPRSDYCCFAVDTGNEDSGSVLVRYESGMHAVYSQNFFARKGAARRGARLYGYKGTIEFDFVSDTIHIYDHMSDKQSVVELHTPAAGHNGGDTELCKNFVRLILGKDQASVASLAEGASSARTCLCATESAEDAIFRPVE